MLAREPDRLEDLIGSVIADRFDLLAFAGAGGMGHVYRARDRQSGNVVALKLLAPNNTEVERFSREAEVLASIDHPGVVRYLAHGETDAGAHYLAMEWLDGEDLSQQLGDGVLGFADTLVVARGVAEALAATHAHGIVHRDLKPANLFLVGRRLDAIKLLDFGIARTPTATDITASGVLVGTPSYMAPEQVRGALLDPRVDVYALGSVMYRCLVGRPPYEGPNQLAVLAKVLLEPLPPIRDVLPDIPRDLELLLLRLLSKDPADRPAGGAAVAAALEALGSASGVLSTRAPAAISAWEQRVECVVLCAGTPFDDATVREHGNLNPADALRRAIAERGGAIDALARGAWVITIPNAASPAEEAARAARCALALAEVRPDAPVVIGTGKVVVQGPRRVGAVIDRAAEALVRASREGTGRGVRIDAVTADLLDARFRVEGDGEWRRLVGEDSATVPVRTLLGHAAPCFGRDAQLATLTGILAGCESESRPTAVLLKAAPGLGKTRLLHEWLASLAPRTELDVLLAHGDPLRAASPFGIVAQMIKRAAGVLDSDASVQQIAKIAALAERSCTGPDAPRVGEILAEICGAPVPRDQAGPALRAARADASVMADAVREAWVDWIGARAARGPVVLVIEDVHWGDAASTRLVEAVLDALDGKAIFVVATSRPEGSAAFADRLRPRGLVEITLAPLSGAASERLVRAALGPSIDDALVRTIAKRAGGHPFHLEELVRAVAGGSGAEALPDSVLGMVQARLDELTAVSRRLLRAASVFGETFWDGGVTALLGDELAAGEVHHTLVELVRQEMLTQERGSKWQGQTEYRFRHALLRDAAYATLADADRARAHRCVADWLAAVGEGDPVVLAEHYDRGGASDRALVYLRRAASQALQCNDLERAMSHTARALALGPDASSAAALRAIEGEILYWRGDLSTAAQRASDAASRLSNGSPEWLDSVAVAIGALGQMGRNDSVAGLLDQVARVDSSLTSRGAHLVALCRGITQLLWAHHRGDLSSVRACLDALVARSGALDPFEAGWVHRARGESAWVRDADVGTCLAELDVSCASFEKARALRGSCLTRLNAASLTGWGGDPKRGLTLVAEGLADAKRLGAGFLLRYGRVVEGLLLAYARAPEARDAMRAGLVNVEGSPRLEYIARVVIGALALEQGDVDAADEESRAARALDLVDELRPAAMALAAQVLTARSRHDEAEALASEAARIEDSCRDLELTYGMAGRSLAEARLGRDDADGAREAIRPTFARLSTIAETIASPEARRGFWERPLPNASVWRLARDLGLAPPAAPQAV